MVGLFVWDRGLPRPAPGYIGVSSGIFIQELCCISFAMFLLLHDKGQRWFLKFKFPESGQIALAF